MNNEINIILKKKIKKERKITLQLNIYVDFSNYYSDGVLFKKKFFSK